MPACSLSFKQSPLGDAGHFAKVELAAVQHRASVHLPIDGRRTAEKERNLLFTAFRVSVRLAFALQRSPFTSTSVSN